MSVHGKASLGFVLQWPLLVRGTNVGQASGLSKGTRGEGLLHAGTVDRWKSAIWLKPDGTNKMRSTNWETTWGLSRKDGCGSMLDSHFDSIRNSLLELW